MPDQPSRAGRRGFLGTASLGATFDRAPGALAQTGGGTPPTAAGRPVITRRIGRTGQAVTALGLWNLPDL
jgi:hypothetical protein